MIQASSSEDAKIILVYLWNLLVGYIRNDNLRIIFLNTETDLPVKLWRDMKLCSSNI